MPARPLDRTGDVMRARALTVVLGLLLCTAAGAAEFATPMARVKDSVGKVIAILKTEGLDREARWQQISAVIDQGFDFQSMSQSVLATHWEKATPDERRRFTEFFSHYIEETYRSKIEAYTNQEIRYGRELIREDRAVVETMIVTDATIIPVNYKLKN